MMRKATYALAAAVVVGAAAQANAQGLEFGVTAGPSFSTLSGFEDFVDLGVPGLDMNTTRRTGLAVGGFVRAGGPSVGLQVEANYVQRGGGIEVSFMGQSGSAAFELAYLEVPVLARVSVPAGAATPFFFAGPAAAFELSCTYVEEYFGDKESEDCDTAGEDSERRKLDVAAVVGGGVSLPVGPGHFLVQGRYSHGLLNLNNAEDEDIENLTIKNRSFGLTAGFAFPLGR